MKFGNAKLYLVHSKECRRITWQTAMLFTLNSSCRYRTKFSSSEPTVCPGSLVKSFESNSKTIISGFRRRIMPKSNFRTLPIVRPPTPWKPMDPKVNSLALRCSCPLFCKNQGRSVSRLKFEVAPCIQKQEDVHKKKKQNKTKQDKNA